MEHTKEQQHDIQLAKDILCQYNYYRHKSRQFPMIGSPVSDGMPNGSITGNSQENKLVKYIDDPAKKYCKECDRLINLIEQEESASHAIILRYTYLRYDKTAIQIADEINVSRRTYFRMLDSALLMFGESANRNTFRNYEREYKLSRKL